MAKRRSRRGGWWSRRCGWQMRRAPTRLESASWSGGTPARRREKEREPRRTREDKWGKKSLKKRRESRECEPSEGKWRGTRRTKVSSDGKTCIGVRRWGTEMYGGTRVRYSNEISAERIREEKGQIFSPHKLANTIFCLDVDRIVPRKYYRRYCKR